MNAQGVGADIVRAASARPIKILVSALGGEGGGVLTQWIVAVGTDMGFPVQSTSIPGVAQRTGATTYYIELVPLPREQLGERQPVLALAPGVGDVDIVLASELLEAARAVGAGYVTPDRTLLITSLSRSYLVVEKMAMTDGRYDSERLVKLAKDHARALLTADMETLSRQSGAMINAVMLGMLAGCGRLPIPPAAFERAIRAADKGAEANLRGFAAGLAAVSRRATASVAPPHDETRRTAVVPDPIARSIATEWPTAAGDVLREGVRRLIDYQDLRYAQLYLDRLVPVRDADARCSADGRLLRETARQLALRMSYEDVIRVAQAKIEPRRIARIAAELGADGGTPFAITEFLKPGVEEICSVLPPALARRILGLAERRRWLDRLQWGMQVKTTSIAGFLRLWVLARLRRFRRGTHRYQEEQRTIEAWLASILEAARLSPDLALEVAHCAGLIKGYGDTLKRGTMSYQLIAARVIEPALAEQIPLAAASDAVASARAAALADPEGEALQRCLDEIEQHASLGVAAE